MTSHECNLQYQQYQMAWNYCIKWYKFNIFMCGTLSRDNEPDIVAVSWGFRAVSEYAQKYFAKRGWKESQNKNEKGSWPLINISAIFRNVYKIWSTALLDWFKICSWQYDSFVVCSSILGNGKSNWKDQNRCTKALHVVHAYMKNELCIWVESCFHESKVKPLDDSWKSVIQVQLPSRCPGVDVTVQPKNHWFSKEMVCMLAPSKRSLK